MAVSTRSDDPAVRRNQPESPRERSVQEKSKTRPGTYALAVAAVIAIGLALLAMGSVRLTQSDASLDAAGVATPAENVLPDGSDGALDREADASEPAGTAPATTAP